MAGTGRPNKEASGDEDRTSGRGQRLSLEQPGAQGSVQRQKGPQKGPKVREEDGSRESDEGAFLGQEGFSLGWGARKRDTLKVCWAQGWEVASSALWQGGRRHVKPGPAGGPTLQGPGPRPSCRPREVTELHTGSVTVGCFRDKLHARNYPLWNTCTLRRFCAINT